LLRMGITLFGFFYASEGSWQRLLICLAGFIAARFLVLLVTKKVDQKQLELQKNVQP
jgi:F1F0 ATPase subunit 2